MPSRLALLRLRLEQSEPTPAEPDDGPGCDHEWDNVEPNPDSTRTIRVCLLCGVTGGRHAEDDCDE